jgi:hypothetical protein
MAIYQKLSAQYPPSSFVDMPMGSVFGMCEMEDAAKRIIEKCAKAGGWDEDGAEVSLDDFQDEDCRIGFLHLLAGGWMEDSETGSHWTFFVQKGFVERLVEKRKLS